jgi:hypothetical protein
VLSACFFRLFFDGGPSDSPPAAFAFAFAFGSRAAKKKKAAVSSSRSTAA